MKNRKELPIDQLLLDRDNPRIGTVSSQPEALNAIVEMDENHFVTMMKSIKLNGLDPGDLFYVLKLKPKEFVVVDGNRRLAAINVLQQPDLLQGTTLAKKTQTRLAKISEDYDPAVVGKPLCVEFGDRETANEWIERRHGRDLKGEERIHWGPLEIQRFQNDRTILDTLDFIEKFSKFDNSTWDQIRSEVERKSSVLDRFLSSKKGRSWLNLEIDNIDDQKLPASSRPPAFLIDVLSKLVEDIYTGEVDSRSYNKASDIESYFDNLPQALKPPKSNVKKYRLSEAKISDKATRPRKNKISTGDKPKPRRRTKPTGPRTTLAPSAHVFSMPSTTKAEELVREASKIRLSSLPLGSAFILRAFLEHSINGYMDDKNLPKTNGGKPIKLSGRAAKTIEHLVASGVVKKTELRGIERILTHPNDPASIQALNDYHHDKYNVPTADILRNAWDQAEPLFIAIHGKS